MFFALKGENVNGERFVEDALEKGASCVVVSKTFDLLDDDRLVFVDDVFNALKVSARKYREEVCPVVVAVTGSVGKTTTKELLYQIFSNKGKTIKTKGNLNTEVGISVTLLSMDDDTEYAVLEHGIDCVGEMEREVMISNPDHAVITIIGSSHLQVFGSREVIFREKYSVSNHLGGSSYLVINSDDDFMSRLADDAVFNTVSVGYSKYSDYRIEDVVGFHSFSLRSKKGDEFKYELAVTGEHFVKDAAFASATALCLGFTYDDVRRGLQQFKAVKGRFEILDNKGIIVVDDSYNSSLESIVSSSISLGEINSKRKFAVLGDVLEISGSPEVSHSKIGVVIDEDKKINFDKVYFYGKMMRHAYVSYRGNKEHFDDKVELIKTLRRELKSGDAILVKASRGIALDEVVDKIMEF